MIQKQSTNVSQFDKAVQSLDVSRSGWLILDRLIGPGNGASLETVAAEFGVSDERIERISKRAVENIRCNMEQIVPLLQILEQEIDFSKLKQNATMYTTNVVSEVRRVAIDHGWGDPNPLHIRNFLVALRAIANAQLPVVKSLPKSIHAVASIVPTLDVLRIPDGISDLSIELGSSPELGPSSPNRSRKSTVAKRGVTDAIKGAFSASATPESIRPAGFVQNNHESTALSPSSQQSDSHSSQLAEAIASLGLSERDWGILERRLGPGNRETLASIADSLGISRARIQQVQKKSAERLYRNRRKIEPILNDLESSLVAKWAFDAAGKEERSVLIELLMILKEKGYADYRLPDRKKLIVTLRAVVDVRPAFADSFPKLTFVACSVDPPIRAHVALSRSIVLSQQRIREEQRNWTYEELAEAVLLEAGEPLHWKVIAERAEQFGRRKNFSTAGFFNAFQGKDEKFARVDTGTYGLAEWGLVDVSNYTDIVAEILDEHGRPLTEGALYQVVSSRRPIAYGSLKMLLDTNPRFYRSAEQTYGLRSWLPARSRQTLRTPTWQVEDADSHKRVDRAERRGYKIGSIVERDRERFPLR